MNFSLSVFDRPTIPDKDSQWVVKDRFVGLCLRIWLHTYVHILLASMIVRL